jgi:pilus assembly protein CpaE
VQPFTRCSNNVISITLKAEGKTPPGLLPAGWRTEVIGLSGSVITILSGKGGCGKTTIAINLAVVLSDEGASRVCLVDLDLALGDIANSLGLRAGASLLTAVTAGGHLDPDLLPDLLTPYLDDVDCLLAPVTPGESEKIPAQVVEDLLHELRSRYDYVVIDTPGRMSSRVLAALDSSDHHVVVTTLEFPALKRVRLTVDTLTLLAHRGASTSIVLNRAEAEGTLTDAEIDEVVRSPIAARVPFSPAVGVSINEQAPLAAFDPDHPVVAAIRELAVTHLGMPSRTAAGASASPHGSDASEITDARPEVWLA